MEGHTTAVILLAAQKEADGLTTGQLLDRLEQGLRQVGDSEVQLVKDGKPMKGENAFQVLCAVLNAAELPQEERKLLVNLSLLGPQGIAPGNLCLWCGLPNRNGLNRLVKRHWVERAEDRVFLSPVIRQVAFETAGVSFAACGPLLKAWNRWYKGLSGGEQYLWRETLQTVGEHACLLAQNGEPGDEKAPILHSLGLRCREQNLRAQAEALYRESLELYRKLSSTNPSVYEPDVAMTCNNLANLLSASPEGREEAEKLYREALKLRRNLAATNPSMYEPDIAGTCNNLAILLAASPEGREEAEELFREALELYRKLAATNPSMYEPNMAGTCNNLALLLSDSTEGREEAEKLYRESLELSRKQARIAPGVYQPDLARVCRNLGRFLQSQGRTEEAAVLFQEAKGE